MPRIGITQGRLSPPSQGRIQSFPTHSWRDEFSLARQAGFYGIEWVYQADTETENPLRTDQGVAEIRKLVANSGVFICSVSADFYMDQHLVAPDGTVHLHIVEHLKGLLQRAAMVEARSVMVPFVDGGRLRTRVQVDGLVRALSMVEPAVDATGVELHMETDLNPNVWIELLQRVGHPNIRVCYEIGDRSSLGYDPVEDLQQLGSWLGSVHIKDRTRCGGSVPLGTRTADLPDCIQRILVVGFDGPFILQPARQSDISELDLAFRHRKFLTDIIHRISQTLN